MLEAIALSLQKIESYFYSLSIIELQADPVFYLTT